MIAQLRRKIKFIEGAWTFLVFVGLTMIFHYHSQEVLIATYQVFFENIGDLDMFSFLKGGRAIDPTNFVN